MKKIFLGILLMVGFLLTVTESSTFAPNVAGMMMALFSADKLKLFES